MMNNLVVFILLSLVQFISTECTECKKPHQVYNPCGNECPKSCRNRTREVACVNVCVSGCFCKSGYILDDCGNCIPLDSCPPEPMGEKKFCICCSNEVFQESGIDCQTCSNYMIVKCAVLEEQKCYCKAGYVRNHNKKCVDPRQCKKCDENEVFVGCNNQCISTCESKGGKGGEICPGKNQCIPCRCKRGYIRDQRTGKCIPAGKCPPE